MERPISRGSRHPLKRRTKRRARQTDVAQFLGRCRSYRALSCNVDSSHDEGRYMLNQPRWLIV